ncbi:hypothetical protein PG994_006563 [Apiospora phragmitis]|uniref:Uncharacterized protein n=1 Tax=Apiospora phragmitis TaxID=2905665 RepID=A0ABR1VFF3_9PEZI
MEQELFEKICQLEATELRQVLLGLCLDPKNKESVIKHIKLLPREEATRSTEPQQSKPSSSSVQPNPGAQNHSAGESSKHSRRTSSVFTTPYTRQKCENCDFWFTAIDNADRACKFHPGMLKQGFSIIYVYLTSTAIGHTVLDPSALIWNILGDGSAPSDWDNENG